MHLVQLTYIDTVVPTIRKPDPSKSEHFCTDFKWFLTKWQPFVWMVGLSDFRSHSKSGSFATQLLFEHLKSRLVQISDSRCSQLFSWLGESYPHWPLCCWLAFPPVLQNKNIYLFTIEELLSCFWTVEFFRGLLPLSCLWTTGFLGGWLNFWKVG